jgi:iron complex outermembrane recepter protein
MHRQVRLSSLLFLLMSTTAYAQSAEDGSVVLPPISVEGAAPTATSPVQGYVAPVTGTATKTDTPLIETPQSISVITRDQLNDRAVQSITDQQF